MIHDWTSGCRRRPNQEEVKCIKVCDTHTYKRRLNGVADACHLNLSADALSHNHMQVFFSVNPEANRDPTRIPEPLWKILVLSQPDWLSRNWRQSLATSLGIASQAAHGGAMLQDSPATSTSAVDSSCLQHQPQSTN